MITRYYLLLIGAFFAIFYIFFMPDSAPLLFSIIIKIIPMLCLLVFLVLLPDEMNDSFKKWITLGLFFCMLGDATLHWFLIGLTFFLLGHFFYILAFLEIKEKQASKWAVLLLLVYGIILSAWIIGNVLRSGNLILSIAIILYVAFILTMLWSSLQTNIATILMGALLFLFSDSILALNMFVTDIHYSTLFIMSTYYTAQFMFTISVLIHFVNRRKVLE